MSWDVHLYKKRLSPLGKEVLAGFNQRDEFHRKINRVFPKTEWLDENFAIVDEGKLVGSFCLETDKESRTIIRVSIDGGTEPKRTLRCLCQNYSWMAFVVDEETFMDLEDCKASGWNNYINYLRKIGYMGESQ